MYCCASVVLVSLICYAGEYPRLRAYQEGKAITTKRGKALDELAAQCVDDDTKRMDMQLKLLQAQTDLANAKKEQAAAEYMKATADAATAA